MSSLPGVEMAVKRMIVTVDDRERKTLQMDVTVIMKAECPYIVKFYGALFREGEVSQPSRIQDSLILSLTGFRIHP